MTQPITPMKIVCLIPPFSEFSHVLPMCEEIDQVCFKPNKEQFIYDTALAIKDKCSDGDVLFFPFHFISDDYFRLNNHNRSGLDLLYLLRKNDVNNHCVIYSSPEKEKILSMHPERSFLMEASGHSLIFCSDIQDKDSIEKLSQQTFTDSFKHYVKADFDPPHLYRHNWANWWGIKQLELIYNFMHSDDPMRLPKLEATTKYLDNQLALYLYGNQLQKADDLTNKDIWSLIQESEVFFSEHPPKILFIDDQHSMGWDEAFKKIFYPRSIIANDCFNSTCPPKEVFLDTESLTTYINKQLLPLIDKTEPNVIFLDLRLLLSEEENRIHAIEKISGAQLLLALRKVLPSIPILIITASNKVWNYKGLLEMGADAFWVKEGLDEGFTLEESLNNYSDLLKITQYLCGDDYQFLYRYGSAVQQLEVKEVHWWHTPEWRIKLRKRFYNDEIIPSLQESIPLLRSYLLKHFKTHTIGDVHTPKYQFELGSIIIVLSCIIEWLHEKGNPGEQFNKKKCGGNFRTQPGTQEVHQIDTRSTHKDFLGMFLYTMRNQAAHQKMNRHINLQTVKIFLSGLIAYLSTEQYAPIDAEKILEYHTKGWSNLEKQIKEIIKTEEKLKTIFEKILGKEL